MDIHTKYMGIPLRSPIIVSACTLSQKLDNIVQMEDHGAGAVVLFSLFEEQIKDEIRQYYDIEDPQTKNIAQSIGLFPSAQEYSVDTTHYLELIRKAKERVDIPIIASLNGTTDEGWIDFARQVQNAGADGLEINIFYIPADIRLSGEDVEQTYLDIVDRVKANIDIPVAVKIPPYFSAMGQMAKRLEDAGADALVLFNRFYQPDIDLTNLNIESSLEYSTANDIRLPMLWISVLYGKLRASLAATSGVESATEVIKYLLAGADTVMTASALYKYGIRHLTVMHEDLQMWMQQFQFQSIAQFRGMMSQRHLTDLPAFERANYIRILEEQKRKE
jgi:dihydroorotate dehydrogenase (fumarate)